MPPAALKGKSRQVRRYAIDGTRGAPGRSLPSGGGRCRATAGDGRGIRRQQPGDTIRNARRGNGDEPGERRAAKTNVGPQGHTMRRSRRRPDGGIGMALLQTQRSREVVRQNPVGAQASALAIWSCSHAMASVTTHGPTPKARSTIRASPTIPPWMENIAAWPLRSARITSKPLIVA